MNRSTSLFIYTAALGIGSMLVLPQPSHAIEPKPFWGINWDSIQQRCLKPDQKEPIITQRDFRWNLTHQENQLRARKIYQSGKRLFERSYFDQNNNSFIVPYRVIGKTSPVKITRNFISSIKHHIELGLKNKYTEAIVFSDMGHSHLYFPEKLWREKYLPLVKQRRIAELYETMLADPELRILYHTAEQIKLKENGKVLPDPHSQWRYWNRNILGYNRPKDLDVLLAEDNKRYNTIVEIPGYHRWSAGFNISASKDGCFPFKHNGETRYFDISLTSLPYRIRPES